MCGKRIGNGSPSKCFLLMGSLSIVGRLSGLATYANHALLALPSHRTTATPKYARADTMMITGPLGSSY